MKRFNRVTLIGNFGKDPEIQELEGGYALAKCSLATIANHFMMLDSSAHKSAGSGKANINENLTHKRKGLRLYRCCIQAWLAVVLK